MAPRKQLSPFLLPLPPRKVVRSDYPLTAPPPRRPSIHGLTAVKSSPSAPARQIRKPRLQPLHPSIHGALPSMASPRFVPPAPQLLPPRSIPVGTGEDAIPAEVTPDAAVKMQAKTPAATPAETSALRNSKTMVTMGM